MTTPALQFSEFLETARRAGFEVVDAGQMPVNEPFQAAVEDDNLMSKQVYVTFRDALPDARRTILANLQVGEETFSVMGDARMQGDLKNLLRAIPAEPNEPHR